MPDLQPPRPPSTPPFTAGTFTGTLTVTVRTMGFRPLFIALSQAERTPQPLAVVAEKHSPSRW